MKRLALLLLLGTLASSKSEAQALSGSYTINPALPSDASNFTSINAAVTALSTNGVSGAVLFSAAPVIFSEQVSIPAIAGASATNTITFAGNNATLRYYPNNAAQRAVLQLNGANYITFDGFKIDAGDTSTSLYGYGVQLLNNADYNTISSCTITVPDYTNSAITDRYVGVMLNSQANATITTEGNADCDFNTIDNNIVKGGQFGVALIAQSNTFMVNGNKVTNNSIVDFYNTGIYINGNNSSLIDNNDISRPARSTSALFYGIQLYNTSYNTTVSRNKIHDPFGGTTNYPSSGANPIYFVNVNALAGQENNCVNNVIYNIQCGSIVRGIWIYNSAYNRFIHNSVSLNQDGFTGFGTTTGVEVGTSNNLTIQNNIISISRTGSSFITRYGMNIGNSISGASIHHNSVYIKSGTTMYYGNWNGTNAATLAAWVTASGDNTSLEQDPTFANVTSGNLMPGNTALVAGIATNINTDILGMSRNTVPTLGAFEIDGVPLSVDMSALTVHTDISSESILSWTSFSEKNNKGFEIQQSEDLKSWKNIGFETGNGGIDATYQYHYNVGIVKSIITFFRVKQLDDNGAFKYSNTVKVTPSKPTLANVELYPNPVENTLYLKAATNDFVTVQIFNLNGQCVLRKELTLQHNAIDVSALPSGTYIFTQNGNAANGKVFIKK